MVSTRSGATNGARLAQREHQLTVWRTQFANFGFDFNQLTVPELVELATELGVAVINYRGARPLKSDYVFFIELHYARGRVRDGAAPDHYLFADFSVQKQQISTLRHILTQHGIRYYRDDNGTEKALGLAKRAEIQKVFADSIDDMRAERGIQPEELGPVDMNGVLSCFGAMAFNHPSPRSRSSVSGTAAPPTPNSPVYRAEPQGRRPVSASADNSTSPQRPLTAAASPSTANVKRSESPVPSSSAMHGVIFGSPSTRSASKATIAHINTPHARVDHSQGFARHLSSSSTSFGVNANLKPAPSSSSASSFSSTSRSAFSPAPKSASSSSSTPGLLNSRKIDRLSTAAETAFDDIITSLTTDNLAEAVAAAVRFYLELSEELPNQLDDVELELPTSARQLSPRKTQKLVASAENTAVAIMNHIGASLIEPALSTLGSFVSDLKDEL